MNVELWIEEVVLDGLAIEPGQTAEVRAAIEAELTRLITMNGIGPGPAQGDGLAGARTSELRLDGTEAPAGIGQRIGQAVHPQIGFQP